MQKKILASLLMVPMAYSAFANIEVTVPVDKEHWKVDGLVGDNLTFDSTTSSVETTVAPVGTGYIQYQTQILPQGTYKLSFQETTNVAVNVNGKKPKATAENTFEFTLEAEGIATIQIGNANPSQAFKFTGLSLEIVCDYAAIDDVLTKTLMDKLYGSGNINDKIKDVNPAALEAKFQNAEALHDEVAELGKQVDFNRNNPAEGTIRWMIRDMRTGYQNDPTPEDAIKIYKKYELWLGAEECVIGVAMNELIGEVTTHNEAVDKLNKSWDIYQTNIANRDLFLEGNNDLQAKLDALEAAINAAAAKPAYDKYGKYITDTTADDIAAIQAAIDADKARIEDAFADDKLDGALIDFTSDNQAIVNGLTALDAKFKAAEADVDAYIQWLNATRDFLNTYATQTDAIKGLAPTQYKTDESVLAGFETYKNGLLADIEDTYNVAVSNFNIKEDVIQNASKYLTGDLNMIKGASMGIEGIAKEAARKLGTQNDYADHDVEFITEAQTALDAIKVPAGANGEEVQAKKNALQKQLDDLNAKVIEAYAKLSLQLDDYSATIQSIKADIDKLAAIVGPLTSLQEKLDAAVAALKKDYPDIAGKFDETIKNLQAAIDALGIDSTVQDMQPTSTAIDQMLDNAAKLDAAWKSAKALLDSYGTAKSEFDTLLTSKIILKPGEKENLKNQFQDSEEYKALEEEYDNFQKAFNEATLLPGQECYNAMLAFSDPNNYNVDTFAAAFKNLSKDFDELGSNSNETYVGEKIEKLKSDAEGDYKGSDVVAATVSQIEDEYAAIGTALDNLNADTIERYKHADYDTNVDAKLQNLVSTIDEVTDTIKDYKELQAIYDQYVLDLGKLQDAIDYDTKYNEDNATADANAHWTKEIADMQKAKDELAAAVDAAYEAYDVATKNLKNKDVKKGLDDKYKAQLEAAQALPGLIKDNEVANIFLLNHSNVIRTAINTEIDNLKAKIEAANAAGNTDLAEELEGWIKELNDLLINKGCSFMAKDGEELKEIFIDLAYVDIAEKDAFNEGQASSGMDGLLEQYDAINSKFQVLKTIYDNHYGDELSAWNHRFDGIWAASLDELLDSYRAAITTYDQYMYGLTHPGYKAYIASALEDHRNIYKYIDKINELEAEVTKYINDKTKAGELISNLDYTTDVAAKQFELNSAINDEVALMEKQVQALAEKYFEENYTEAKDSIAMATTKLTQAGVSDDFASEALAKYNNELAEAVKAEDDAKKNEKISYGIAMDAIAGFLDNAKVPSTFDYDAVAQTEWEADLFAADATIADLEAEKKAAEFATEAVKDAEQAKFDEAKAAIEELKAAPYSPAELDTLLGLQDALKEALDKAQAATDAIKADSAANKANQDAYDELTAVISDYEDQLAALTQFVNGLVVDEAKLLNIAKTAVEDLKKFVEENKASLVDKTTTKRIKNLKAKIDKAIQAAYGKTVTDENKLLGEWIGRLKAAYNDAKVNADIATFDEDYAEVKAFIDANIETITVDGKTEEVVKLPAYSDPSFNKDDYTEAATEIEFNIAQYYNELQKLWDKDKNGNKNPNANPYQDALAKVNAVFDETSKDMQDAYAELLAAEELKTVNEEAYNAFEEAYQAINEEMEQIQGRFTGEGVRIIFNWEEFVSELAEMSSKIAGLAAQVDEAQAAAIETYKAWQVSDAKATELQGTIDELTTQLEALKAKVAEYDINDTAINGQIADIEDDIETAQKNLDADKADHKLIETDVLKPDDAGISSAIFNTGVKAAKVYANKGVTEAKAASTELCKELQKNVVPEIRRALRTEQLQLKTDLEGIQNAINAVDLDDIDTTAATFEALHDQAAEIKARLEEMLKEATENIFILGDVDGDEDGLVTAADVQLLIQWVGEGKTYEDLYAMSPVIAAAANVAQESGQAPAINIADITAEINLVMNADYDTPNAAKFVQRRAAAQGSISAVSLGGNRYAIALNSTQAFVAGQLDIVLPAGVQIVNAELVGMSHQLYQFNNDGYTRMIVASMNNEELKGDQLLIIEVEGNGAPEVDNALFTDSEANTYTLGKGTVTGIEGIEAENGMVQRIYNAAGQAMRTIQRGINIIRHSDGTTTKELHK